MEDGTELLLNMTDSPLIIDATGSSKSSGSTDTDRTMEKGRRTDSVASNNV